MNHEQIARVSELEAQTPSALSGASSSPTDSDMECLRASVIEDCPCGKTNWKTFPHFRLDGETETFCLSCGWKVGCHPTQKPENARVKGWDEPVGEPNAIIPNPLVSTFSTLERTT